MRKTTARLIIASDFIFGEVAYFISMINDSDYEALGVVWILDLVATAVCAFVLGVSHFANSPGDPNYVRLRALGIPVAIFSTALCIHGICYLVAACGRFKRWHDNVMPAYKKELQKIIAAEPVVGPVEEKGHLSVVEKSSDVEGRGNGY